MNTNDKMQPTSSASSKAMRDQFIANYGHLIARNLDLDYFDLADRDAKILAWLYKFESQSDGIVPPVVQAPTDRQILDFASYAYNRGGLSVGFTDVAALDKFREIVGVAAPIVATVPCEQKPMTQTAREAIAEAIAFNRSNFAQMTDEQIAGEVINALDGELGIYEDVYEQCCDLIDPLTNDGPYDQGDTKRPFQKSVVGTLSMLIDHWKATNAAPSPTEQASDVRNAALEKAAILCKQADHAAQINAARYCKEGSKEWAKYWEGYSDGAAICARAVAELKSATPADKGNATAEVRK